MTGFGALTGGAVRCRVYGSAGVTPVQVGRMTVFTGATLAVALVLMTALGTETLPTTVFYDAKGKELWRVYGMMDWNGAPAKKLIGDAVGG